MAQVSDITVTLRNGALGARNPNQDGVSAIVFVGMAEPAGFPQYGRARRLVQAEALGLSKQRQLALQQPDHYHVEEFFRTFGTSGDLYLVYHHPTARAAQTSFAITSGSAGAGNQVTQVAAGATNLLSAPVLWATSNEATATAVRAAINGGTGTHGYSASGTGAQVVVAAPVGSAANGQTLTVTIGGDVVASIAETFVGGAAQSPALDVQLRGLQAFAKGSIRQIAVVGNYAKPELISALTAATEEGIENKNPFNVLQEASAASLLTSQKFISRVTAQDLSYLRLLTGTAAGALLPAWAQNVSAAGAVLGLIARLVVSRSAAHVAFGDISDAAHFTEIGFTDGATYEAEVTAGNLETREAAREIYARILSNYPGVYLNADHTLTPEADDYKYAHRGRTIGKAIRELYAVGAQDLNAPLYPDAEGRLSEGTIAAFRDRYSSALERMITDGEITGYTINIDPDQDILATDTLAVEFGVQTPGVARFINWSIGFTLTTSTN